MTEWIGIRYVMHAERKNMSRSWAHAVNAVLFAVCIGLGGGTYAELLPARAGVLPIIAVLSTVLYYGGAWWMQRYPSSVNMPSQSAYDALPEEDQQKVIACMLPFCYWSVTLWMGFGIFIFLFPTLEMNVVALVLATSC